MPAYLLQVAYTPQALSALIANPHDRTQALKKNVRNLGGKMVGSWFAFGEYDLIAIMEFPDNVSAAAWALATAAGGALRSVKTTPLLSIEEGLEALRKVPESKYQSIVAS
ncbi:MAG: GYD domain-containing protein [Terracidiphilus sp.]